VRRLPARERDLRGDALAEVARPHARRALDVDLGVLEVSTEARLRPGRRTLQLLQRPQHRDPVGVVDGRDPSQRRQPGARQR
jgi:hypothetical protein